MEWTGEPLSYSVAQRWCTCDRGVARHRVVGGHHRYWEGGREGGGRRGEGGGRRESGIDRKRKREKGKGHNDQKKEMEYA